VRSRRPRPLGRPSRAAACSSLRCARGRRASRAIRSDGWNRTDRKHVTQLIIWLNARELYELLTAEFLREVAQTPSEPVFAAEAMYACVRRFLRRAQGRARRHLADRDAAVPVPRVRAPLQPRGGPPAAPPARAGARRRPREGPRRRVAEPRDRRSCASSRSRPPRCSRRARCTSGCCGRATTPRTRTRSTTCARSGRRCRSPTSSAC
jgi:hypothetical protein